MAGTFIPGAVRPILAGSYFAYEAAEQATLPIGTGQIVAIVETGTWGPINTPTLYGSYEGFKQVDPTSSPIAKRVYDAFRGQGVDGEGGAGGVLVYRNADATAARPAVCRLSNTAGSPAVALTLTARWTGTFGNGLRATVQAGVDVGTSELVLLNGTLVLATYPFDDADLDTLAATLNDVDGFVTAVVNARTDPLADVANATFTGGVDGATLTATQYTNLFTALESQRFSVLALCGLTDATIRASARAWILARNAAGKRCRAVVGGAASESIATANTRSRGLNTWEMINLGGVTFYDDDRGEDLPTTSFVARFAGMLAARGEMSDVMFARFAGVSLRSALTTAEEVSALEAGTTTFTRDTNAEAPVFCREAVTAYVDDSGSTLDQNGNKTHPVAYYKRIKNVAIQHGVEIEVTEEEESGRILGRLAVNEQSRSLVLNRVNRAYERREAMQIVQPGWVVRLDPTVPISDDDDFVAYQHAVAPTRTMRQIFHTVVQR